MSRYLINLEMRYFMTYDNSNLFYVNTVSLWHLHTSVQTFRTAEKSDSEMKESESNSRTSTNKFKIKISIADY